MIKDALFGLATGDALGVPVEFKDRRYMMLDPVTGMRGYGMHNKPAGTWSDDSSLAFCLAEALTKQFDLRVVADNFQKWLYEDYWTPAGGVFDVGISTRAAIERLKSGTRPDLAGGVLEEDNGNGSLMRILPLIFYTSDKSIDERYVFTKLVSSVTHRHIRSVIACFYYLEFARGLLMKENKFSVYKNLQTSFPDYLASIDINPAEIKLFDRLLRNDIHSLRVEDIKSGGYVLHTLEAGIWCLLTTSTYSEAVLKAVNLGADTDTTGAVTGGLAGMLYGFNGIPAEWVEQLARREDIEDLAKRMEAQLIT